jgi:hypothetical protein
MTFSAFVVRRWLSSHIARTYRPSMSTRRYELKSSHIRYLVLISCRIPLHRVPSIRAGVISAACRLTRPGVLRRGNVSIGSVCVSHTDFMLFTIPCVHDYGRPDVLPRPPRLPILIRINPSIYLQPQCVVGRQMRGCVRCERFPIFEEQKKLAPSIFSRIIVHSA